MVEAETSQLETPTLAETTTSTKRRVPRSKPTGTSLLANTRAHPSVGVRPETFLLLLQVHIRTNGFARPAPTSMCPIGTPNQ
jgi:hypothetical protein